MLEMKKVNIGIKLAINKKRKKELYLGNKNISILLKNKLIQEQKEQLFYFYIKINT